MRRSKWGRAAQTADPVAPQGSAADATGTITAAFQPPFGASTPKENRMADVTIQVPA